MISKILLSLVLLSSISSLTVATYDDCRKNLVAILNESLVVYGYFYKGTTATDLSYYNETSYFTRRILNVIQYCGGIWGDINQRIQYCIRHEMQLPKWNFDRLRDDFFGHRDSAGNHIPVTRTVRDFTEFVSAVYVAVTRCLEGAPKLYNVDKK